jgi:hypothetical protein
MDQTVNDLEKTIESVVSVDQRYITEPMSTVTEAEQPLSEEELHRLFEEAISDCVLVVNARLHRISRPLPFQTLTAEEGRFSDSVETPTEGNPRQRQGSVRRWLLLPNNPWQQVILLLSLTLFFLLSGFDLMGVLVLYLR